MLKIDYIDPLGNQGSCAHGFVRRVLYFLNQTLPQIVTALHVHVLELSKGVDNGGGGLAGGGPPPPPPQIFHHINYVQSRAYQAIAQ